jgi:thiol-disulfide isomerase/thioredoxin
MKPVVDGLKQQYAGKVEFRRLDVNLDATQVLANLYQVEYTPTFVFINSDGTRSDQLVGEVAAPQITQRLDALK